MSAPFKKLLLASLALFFGVMSSGVMAATVTNIGVNEYAYFNGTSTTNYDLTFESLTTAQLPLTNYTSQPWYNNSTVAGLFASAVGSSSGLTNMGGMAGPYFSYSYAYSVDRITVDNLLGFTQNTAICLGGCSGGWQTMVSDGIPSYYASATVNTSAGAPEIDGSLAPKVGFLLGCLFLMFGRRKQNTEPMMTA